MVLTLKLTFLTKLAFVSHENSTYNSFVGCVLLQSKYAF